MKPNNLFLSALAFGTLSLANRIDVSTTSINNPATITKTVVDTTTLSRPLDYNALRIEQNEVLSSAFSNAQSIIASAVSTSPIRPSSVSVVKLARSLPRDDADHHDPEELPGEPEYWTLTLWINGYDVIIPVLKNNATDFCKSISSEIGQSSSTVETVPSVPSVTESQEPVTSTDALEPTTTNISKEPDPEPTSQSDDSTEAPTPTNTSEEQPKPTSKDISPTEAPTSMSASVEPDPEPTSQSDGSTEASTSTNKSEEEPKPTSKDVSRTEAPTSTNTSEEEPKSTSKDVGPTQAPTSMSASEEPDPEPTSESADPTDSPSTTETPNPSIEPTKSRDPGKTSTAEPSVPKTLTDTDIPSETSDYASQTLSKSHPASSFPTTTVLSSTKQNSTFESASRKTTISTLGFVFPTPSTSSLEGESHGVGKAVDENAKAWASYSSYMEAYKSSMDAHERDPDAWSDAATGYSSTSTKEVIQTTTSAEETSGTRKHMPTEASVKKVDQTISVRQQVGTSSGVRNIRRWLPAHFTWRRHPSEVEKVQGWSRRQHDSPEIEKVQGWSKRPSPNRMHEGHNQQDLSAADSKQTSIQQTASSTVKSSKPIFSFDPHPHPSSTVKSWKPIFSFDPHPHPSSTVKSSKPIFSFDPHPRPRPTSHPKDAHPTSPELGVSDSSTPPAHNHTSETRPPPPTANAPSQTTSGNATHGPEPTSGAEPKWPTNPFVAPLFWGVGAGYLGLAYWQGYQQARGRVKGLEVGDAICRWFGEMMVKHW